MPLAQRGRQRHHLFPQGCAAAQPTSSSVGPEQVLGEVGALDLLGGLAGEGAVGGLAGEGLLDPLAPLDPLELLA
ncbi:hypothetical protein [Tabrizicola sp. YIM 78059]|uniref:hypothetical protein n=1 Tax=Tabrizicola sp. YIM 78059 TaxID=2529861 RepID=UPI0010AB40D2|nr:hypothetical protein [Tabrizicola sp. YIM 78059]